MSWVTILWSMNAAACLTLAAIYLLVWSKHRGDWVHLLFSFTAISVAVVAGFELAMMRSETTEQFGTVMRWAQVPIWALIVSLVWFVRFRLRAGRTWLAWSVCALRSLALFLNFLFSPNLNYRQIASLQQVSWWGGEKVSVATGVPNPWTLIGHLGLLLFLVFLIDATVVAWRRGDRRRALIVGGGAIFFVAMGSAQALLVIWGVIRAPFFISFPYLGIVVAMAYELSSEVLRAAFIDLAGSEAVDEGDALFYLGTSRILTELHAKKPLARLQPVGRIPVALRKDGRAIVALQWDYAAWTGNAANFIGLLQASDFRKKPSGLTIAISGDASPLAQQKLKDVNIELVTRIAPGPLR